ncbi:DUF4123 domain-containing protein [Aquabacterium sp.]|uniref:DUF4123 domain-containing protein n=1 Tax=Aquabacterium sp. TaxID=1872578 RepID=UPI0025BC5F13|nr:DUF4123 domain-containing protein [Aquabacterium sp.]
MQAYWLIDPTIEDPKQNLPELGYQATHPIAIDHPDSRSYKAPYLVMCPQGLAGDRLSNVLLDLAIEQSTAASTPGEPQIRSVTALILSEAPLPVLVHGLSRAAVVRDCQRKTRVFRYWDPRLWSALHETPVLQTLLPSWRAPVEWVHLDDERATLVRHEAGGSDRPTATNTGPQQLSMPQESALNELSNANRVIATVSARQGNMAQGITRPLALDALRAVAHTPLRQPDDLIALASWRVQTAQPIEEAPRVQNMIQQSVMHGVALDALLAELSPQDWLAIQTTTREARRS